jgi:hydroxymethylpyrimidine pyrophosphatase-like HAD family hydrolase
VAGDSANDLTMFDVSLMGIAVANAREELTERLDPTRSYLAPHPFARGVLDGLRHWIPETAS